MADEQEFNLEELDTPEQPAEIEEIEHKDNFSIEYEETPKEVEPEKEEPKEEPKVDPKEDPTQNPYWQSKYDKEVLATKQEAEKLRQELEQLKGQVNPPKQEEPLVRPQKPNSDDPLDMLKYSQELAEYQEKVMEQKFKSVDSYFQNIEAERQMRTQQEQAAQQKAWMVGQMTKAGLSPEEAGMALADFTKDADNPDQYFKDLADFWRHRKGQKTDPRAQNMEKRATRQQGLPPLGVATSENEPQNVNPDDAFFNSLKQMERKYF